MDLGEPAMKENLVLLAPSGNVLIKRWFQSGAQFVRKKKQLEGNKENSLIRGFSEFGKDITSPFQQTMNKTGKAFEW